MVDCKQKKHDILCVVDTEPSPEEKFPPRGFLHFRIFIKRNARKVLSMSFVHFLVEAFFPLSLHFQPKKGLNVHLGTVCSLIKTVNYKSSCFLTIFDGTVINVQYLERN